MVCELVKGIRLVDRDKKIIREIDRWRVCQGRHIRELAGFSGQRACDRRLRKLIDAGYISRQKILYGVAGIYQNTSKATKINEEGLQNKNRKIRLEQIVHDIAVLDTAIFFWKEQGIELESIKTELELHRLDGFGVRRHRPDFVYNKDNKKVCVEIELALKSKHRFENIMRNNFKDYDRQIWIVPTKDSKIAKSLINMKKVYSNIELLEISEVKKYE